MSIITILLRKWCPNKKHFAELDLQHGGKTAGIDMIWRNYVTVTICLCTVLNGMVLLVATVFSCSVFWMPLIVDGKLKYCATVFMVALWNRADHYIFIQLCFIVICRKCCPAYRVMRYSKIDVYNYYCVYCYYEAASQYHVRRCGSLFRQSSVVCLSRSWALQNGSTSRETVWDVDLGGPRELFVGWGPDPSMRRVNFEGKGSDPL